MGHKNTFHSDTTNSNLKCSYLSGIIQLRENKLKYTKRKVKFVIYSFSRIVPLLMKDNKGFEEEEEYQTSKVNLLVPL